MRCANCILSDKYPGIEFNASGVCNICTGSHTNLGYKGRPDFESLEKDLIRILKKHKGKKSYDCLIPLSGGKDSTYILYLCVKKYHMKPLAVTVDNGFFSDIGRNNVLNAVEILGVDHILFRPAWKEMRHAFRKMVENYGFSCVFCDYILVKITKQIQKKYDISLIIFGGSPRTQGRPPGELYLPSDETIWHALGMEYRSEYPWLYNTTAKGVMNLGLIRKMRNRIRHYARKAFKPKAKIGEIALPYYLEWNEDEITEILKRELQWQQKAETSEHVDCYLPEIKDYVARNIWGFCWQEIKYSDLIRDSQMTREEAIELLKKDEERIKKTPEYLVEYLEKIGYSESDFQEILENKDNKPFRFLCRS